MSAMVGTSLTSRRKKATLAVSTLGSKLFASLYSFLVVGFVVVLGRNFSDVFHKITRKNASSKSEEKEAGKRL